MIRTRGLQAKSLARECVRHWLDVASVTTLRFMPPGLRPVKVDKTIRAAVGCLTLPPDRGCARRTSRSTRAPAEPLRLALRPQPRSVSPRFSVVVVRCAPAVACRKQLQTEQPVALVAGANDSAVAIARSGRCRRAGRICGPFGFSNAGQPKEAKPTVKTSLCPAGMICSRQGVQTNRAALIWLAPVCAPPLSAIHPSQIRLPTLQPYR